MDQFSVGESWASYFETVVPDDAGPGQITETRRAFYSGALTVLMVVERIGEPDISEAMGLEILRAVKAEMIEFQAGIGKGH